MPIVDIEIVGDVTGSNAGLSRTIAAFVSGGAVTVKLVLCFRNNRPMVSGCTVDFITPGVDDRLAVDVVDEGHQAVLEFMFGSDADMAQ